MPGNRLIVRTVWPREEITYDGRQLRQDPGEDPPQTLDIQHVPQTCRIFLVKHTGEHDAKQSQILNKVDQNAPPKVRRAVDRAIR